MAQQQKWSKLLAREGVDITTLSYLDAEFYKVFFDFLKVKKEYLFSYAHQKSFTHYTNVNFHDFGKHLFQKHLNSPAKVKKEYQKSVNLLEKTCRTAQKWQKKLNEQSQTDLILSAYSDFKQSFAAINYTYSVIPWVVIEYWQHGFEDMLSQLIKKRNLLAQQDDITASAYHPWKKTAIPEIQDKLRHGADIGKLTEQYQFLRSWSAIWYRPIDKEWITNMGKKSMVHKPKYYSREKLKKILLPNAQETKYLELAPYLIFFKDWRDDLRRKHVYCWSFLFQLIAKRLNVEYNDLGYLSVDEIEQSLKTKKIDNKKINWRKNNPSVVTFDVRKNKIVIIDKNIQKYSDLVAQVSNDIYDNQQTVTIKGFVAEMGKVQGTVRIVNTFHDIKKVLKGEILVANTTHPNYLPAMQKAAAFVTNEGGVISHAAIVARELKKPCIVGTKIATKVLHDGDLVEVDANEGVVRILKEK